MSCCARAVVHSLTMALLYERQLRVYTMNTLHTDSVAAMVKDMVGARPVPLVPLVGVPPSTASAVAAGNATASLSGHSFTAVCREPRLVGAAAPTNNSLPSTGRVGVHGCASVCVDGAACAACARSRAPPSERAPEAGDGGAD